ncbi:hypothetical protein [Georgenia yuyongxinii]
MNAPRTVADIDAALDDLTAALMRLGTGDGPAPASDLAAGDVDTELAVLRAVGYLHGARKELARLDPAQSVTRPPSASEEDRR